MNQRDFNEFLREELVQAEQLLLDTKGIEYSSEDDRFSDFKVIGEELNLSPIVIAYIFYRKHVQSLSKYVRSLVHVRKDYVPTEPIMSRVHDSRNYLALIAGLFKEIENESEKADIPVPRKFS